MRRRVLVPVLLLLAAMAARAEEPGAAPLESSKQALKALQADQAAKQGASATGKLSDGLPSVQTPTPGASPLDYSQFRPDSKKETELKRKKDEQKNWLVDGVDKLERDAKGRGQKGGDGKTDLVAEEEEKPDSSDPNYMLKLYTEQKKEAEAKAEARQTTTARTDPIAPFLQGWLGNSPVRGKFFDEFARKPDGGSSSVSSTNLPESGGGASLNNSVRPENNRAPVPANPAPNPYLSGLNSAPGSTAGFDRIGQSPGNPVSQGAPPAWAPVPAIESVPAARPAGKKPSPLAPSESEKYFPQQKKF